MSLIFASIPPKRLAQGITSAGSSFYVNNILSFDGVNDVAPSDLGTQHYVCFRNDTGTRVEFMEIDPTTISAGPITIVRRGLSYYGDRTTESTDLKYDWSANETLVMFGTDVPQIFQYLKEYIDAASIAGSVPASTTAAGIVVEASQTEVNAGTITKIISAVTYKLFAPLDKLLVLINAKTQLLYPIGSLYLSTVSTNPNTLFGFGTWVAFGQGRVLVGVGTGSIVATFASRSSDTITVTGLTNAANNEFQTGQAVTYHTTGSVITGLSNDTVYYIVRISNTSFKLASNLGNAQNSTIISLSGDGTGTQTFTLPLTARASGDTGGEENHAMSLSELLLHQHTQSGSDLQGNGTNDGSLGSSGRQVTINNVTNAVGGNAAMNIMQPFIACYMWKRTA